MRNVDLYFPERRTFFFSGCLPDAMQPLWIVLVELVPTLFFPLPRNRCRVWQLSVLWYTTQRSHTFHNVATALLSSPFLCFSVWFFCNLAAREWALSAELTIPIYSEGCPYSQSDLMQVPCKKYLHGARFNFSDWLLPVAILILDTLLHRVFVQLSVSASHDRYSHAGNDIGLPSNTALFSFPLVTTAFSSFDTT